MRCRDLQCTLKSLNVDAEGLTCGSSLMNGSNLGWMCVQLSMSSVGFLCERVIINAVIWKRDPDNLVFEPWVLLNFQFFLSHWVYSLALMWFVLVFCTGTLYWHLIFSNQLRWLIDLTAVFVSPGLSACLLFTCLSVAIKPKRSGLLAVYTLGLCHVMATYFVFTWWNVNGHRHTVYEVNHQTNFL